jgi:chromosomal replication initiation ATPase DnaA
MNLNHPHIKKLLFTWQAELQKKTNNKVLLIATLLPVNKENISPKVICKTVCRYTGVPLDKAMAECREKELIITRHLIAYFIKAYANLSYKKIAALMNKECHTTIMSNVKRLKSLIESGDPEICNLVIKINLALQKKCKHATQPS